VNKGRPDSILGQIGKTARCCDANLFYIFPCLYLCFFVSKITRKRLDRFARNFQGRCGVTTGVRDDLITFLVNSEKPRDAATRNTGPGFVVLSHHSLLIQFNETMNLYAADAS